jgi:hypothetical protein
MGRQEEKRTLPGASADVSAFACVAANKYPHPGAGMLTGFPFGQKSKSAQVIGTTLSLRID